MKMMRSFIIALAALLLTPAIFAQDLSKYRDFSLGMHLADAAKRADKTPTDARVVQQKPALIQELTWWPAQPYQSSAPVDAVEETMFSFYNGALYKIVVTYDTTSTKGLTASDMIETISAKYGVANLPVAKAASTGIADYSNNSETIAFWEDPQYLLTLSRSPVLDEFQLVMFSKQTNSQAETSVSAAATQAREDAPQMEIARAKQEAEDLEATRQANLKAFRP